MPNAVRNQASVRQQLSCRPRPGVPAPLAWVALAGAVLSLAVPAPAAASPPADVPVAQARSGGGGQPPTQAPGSRAARTQATPDSRAASALAEARRLYNLGRYEAAVEAAGEVPAQSAVYPEALLVLGRSRLERFRQTADEQDLAQGRDDLRSIDASRLDERDRLELLVGFGQALFLENEFRAAAEVFTSALDNASPLGGHARDQLLDWWATSLDRHAQSRPVADRPAIYDRLVAQMEQELRRDASAGSASYWLAAGLRLRGELDRAWDAALAGWVRALMTPDRGAALRPDLESLIRDALIPDRARRATAAGEDTDQALASMFEEWEAFKKRW